MTHTATIKHTLWALALVIGLAGLTGCGAGERLANVGKPPEMTPVENPQTRADYRPVSMPMPAPESTAREPNSLWASNRRNFFKDQRAGSVGDILTVLIDIKDEAGMENRTNRSRSGNENAGLPGFLGYEASLDRILPEAVNPGSLTEFGSTSTNAGSGITEREEDIQIRMAAVVTQILPNGNMVITGSQEVRVNFEKRVLQIAGVIRPEDVSINNTIKHDQIAEARIIYGGEGHLTDVQQPRYGQQIYDILFPF